MNIAICDDIEMFRTELLELGKEYSLRNKNIEIFFSAFKCTEDLLDAAQRIGGFDIYILDIVMPTMNGIELGAQLRQSGYDGKIIYLTSSREFAIDSYKVKAFNYILKPIEKNEFFSALHEAVESIATKKNKSLIVKTKDNNIRLAFDSIMYAELCRRVIVYHLTSGKIVESTTVRTTFSEAVQELLKDKRFVLCNSSLVANMHYITMVENEYLIFKDICKVHLSKKACRQARSAWYDYWFDGDGSK